MRKIKLAACLLAVLAAGTGAGCGGEGDEGKQCSGPSDCSSNHCLKLTCSSGEEPHACAGQECGTGCPSGQKCVSLRNSDEEFCVPSSVCD
jgi:hypothetical protein